MLKKKKQTNHQMIIFYWYNSILTYECDSKIANKQATLLTIRPFS